MAYNNLDVLGIFRFDDVGDALGGGGFTPADGQHLGIELEDPHTQQMYIPVGRSALFILELLCVPKDGTFSGPAADAYLGLRVRYSQDGGASYTTAAAFNTSGMPQIAANGVADNLQDFTKDLPLRVMQDYVGLVGVVSHSGVRLPASSIFTVDAGCFASGGASGVSIDRIDDFYVFVYGRYV